MTILEFLDKNFMDIVGTCILFCLMAAGVFCLCMTLREPK